MADLRHVSFPAQRRRIRAALLRDGVARDINDVVEAIVGAGGEAAAGRAAACERAVRVGRSPQASSSGQVRNFPLN